MAEFVSDLNQEDSGPGDVDTSRGGLSLDATPCEYQGNTEPTFEMEGDFEEDEEIDLVYRSEPWVPPETAPIFPQGMPETLGIDLQQSTVLPERQPTSDIRQQAAPQETPMGITGSDIDARLSFLREVREQQQRAESQ